MKKLRKNVAGIDIGAKDIFVALEDGPVKSFKTFTEDFKLCANYLKDNNVKSVAMEATGSYWIILYMILENAGFEVWLVDGRETKQVPGRKTDVKDCQWIQQLHSYGLLNRCFTLEEEMKNLRSYNRIREDHIRSSSMHILHMQKALIEMNIRLKEVISQIHGASGMKIIEAILAGERDKEKLTSLCNKTILKNKRNEVKKSLEGYYTEAGLFALKQAYDSYQFYQHQISLCDGEIEKQLIKLGGDKKDEDLDTKRKPIRHNKPKVKNLGANLIGLHKGYDPTVLEGMTDYSWLKLTAELGYDLSKWKTEKHFTSWAGLAPGQNNSGKKRQSRKKRNVNHVGQVFKDIAFGLINNKNSAIGEFGRRIRSRKGAVVAIKTMARKLAILYWKLSMEGIDYVKENAENYRKKLRERKEKNLKKLAKELNMQVIESKLNA
jgi:transposase